LFFHNGYPGELIGFIPLFGFKKFRKNVNIIFLSSQTTDVKPVKLTSATLVYF